MNATRQKPLISFIILTYNQADYINEAICGALAQTYSPLEIIISDDCSTDNTFKIIEQIVSTYSGKHIIIINYNKTNLGIGEHLNNVLELCSGELIIGSAGDDISLPNRVEKLVNVWLDNNKKYKAIFSNAIVMNEKSNISGPYYNSQPIYAKTLNDFINDKRSLKIKISQPAVWQLGATAAFEKKLFTIYGRSHPKTLQDDGVYAFRALLQGEMLYIDEPLVKYRIHSASVSNMKNLNTLKKFKVLQHFYKLSQLNDARLTHSENKRLINKLNHAYYLSILSGLLYKIPFYSHFVFYTKKTIKYIINVH